MLTAIDHVYAVPVADRWLVWSPWRRYAALVNGVAVDALRREAGAGSALVEMKRLLREPIAPLPTDSPDLQPLTVRPPFLGLVPSRDCNMSCRYCEFTVSGEPERMEPRTVVQAVDAWVAHQRSIGADLLSVHFFGGEPFCAADLVRLAVHRTRAAAAAIGLPTHFEASTNGLVAAGELEFVRAYFDTIVLSLDGTRESFDRTRRRSNGASCFDEVLATARALSASPVELCLRCCVSAATVADMPALATWFADELDPDVVNFEPLRPTARAADSGLSPPAPDDFARGLVAAWRRLANRGIRCTHSAVSGEARRSFCPVGSDAFIVFPDRTVRSCYLPRRQWEGCGRSMMIGNLSEDGDLHLDQRAITDLRCTGGEPPRCHTCFCRWTCAGGCPADRRPGPASPDENRFCRQTRLLQAAYLLEGLGGHSTADELLGDPAARSRLAVPGDDRLWGRSL